MTAPTRKLHNLSLVCYLFVLLGLTFDLMHSCLAAIGSPAHSKDNVLWGSQDEALSGLAVFRLVSVAPPPAILNQSHLTREALLCSRTCLFS